MATPDEVKLQKGTVAPTQAEQTGSAKAVSLIDNLLFSQNRINKINLSKS